MISNHIGDLLTMRPRRGFGLGYSMILDAGKTSESLTPAASAGARLGHLFLRRSRRRHRRRHHDSIDVVWPFANSSGLGTLTMQAIIKPMSSGGHAIRAYQPLH